MKELSEMTLEELWDLFRITLVDPEPEKWRKQFLREKTLLEKILGDLATRISHVGSTAVGTIKCKPIVDIIVETENVSLCVRVLEDKGYIVMRSDGDRASLNKGYTPEGYADEVFHIHIRRPRDADEVFFCDYLKMHRETAKEYEVLKIKLLKEYGKDRDGYTKAKTPFVMEITQKAKKEQKTNE